MVDNNYTKFISAKLEYSIKKLLKQVSPEYYSIIEVFIKSNVDIVAEHKEKWYHKIHFEKSKKALFVHNYKTLSDQKTAAIKKYINEHLDKGFI